MIIDYRLSLYLYTKQHSAYAHWMNIFLLLRVPEVSCATRYASYQDARTEALKI